MSSQQGTVILASFKVKPDSVEAFLEAARRHAQTSLSEEPGCQQFDVVQDGEDPGRVLLYEVYADDAAVEAHRGQPYMERFRLATQDLVEERTITRMSRLHHPRKGRPGAKRVLVCSPQLKDRGHLLEPLRAAGLEPVMNPHGRPLKEDELIALLPGCVATIASIEPYNDRVFGTAPQLKAVARMGVGYDQIDVAAATRHDVAVAMAFGTNHEAVADHAFAMMGALASRLADYDQRVRSGGWGSMFHGRLHGATVGIIGFGRIGRAVAKRCQGFNMEVLVTDPAMDAETVARLGCRLVPMDELLAASDFVTLHCPLAADTRGLIDARCLGLMKPGAFLVNTARGGVVDEAALHEALASGRIAGAGIDVFEVEPMRESPLKALPNVILTPHVAGVSGPALEAMTMRCVESIIAIAVRGEDPGGGLVLNPEALAARRARDHA
ncbi:NAD(P)-dependent oxidoreductase [Marinimicrococcus flavescens]|uniref:NAD(P)-dependent oxidoreductase n=1 Tax=Marinimicrococcus flavescens TaxID=3031815 RepID=A0AAP3UXC9_9PROT|nr:NAD(P)-dependent oxidoreductase [Marinimicrococcus flavescens]